MGEGVRVKDAGERGWGKANRPGACGCPECEQQMCVRQLWARDDAFSSIWGLRLGSRRRYRLCGMPAHGWLKSWCLKVSASESVPQQELSES
jgi:hypothetical protein